MPGPLILPKRYGDRIEEAIATESQAVPARVHQAETFLRKKNVNVYQCPVCSKIFRHDDEYEPLCTGWNETTDDHPLTVMKLVAVEPPKIVSIDPVVQLVEEREQSMVVEAPPVPEVSPPDLSLVPDLLATSGIAPFRDTHIGEDVYVLGAGPSLNYLDPGFFANKTVIAVNSSARSWHGLTPTYIVVKEHVEEAIPNAAAFPGVPIICSHGPYGREYADLPAELRGAPVYVYEHLPNKAGDFDVYQDWPLEEDHLVVSMSTITTAMHFAAYLGAKNILVAGHDCGRLGEDLYVENYRDGDPAAQPEWMPGWLASIERQSLAVKRELTRRYGVRIYGLSPFITPNLDGITYVGGTNRINAW